MSAAGWQVSDSPTPTPSSNWTVSDSASPPKAPAQEGFWHSLASSLGVDPDAPPHVKDALINAAIGPAGTLARGAYQGYMRTTSELGQAVDALRGKSTDAGPQANASVSQTAPNYAAAATHAISAIPIVGPALTKGAAQYNEGNIAGEVGTALGGAIQAAPIAEGLGAGRMVAPVARTSADAAKTAFNYVRDAAADNPDAAALRALNTPAKSKFAQRNLQAIDASRPYLQGAQNLAEAQTKLADAKTEVWTPRQQAVDFLADQQVKGPDGITTVGDLEKQRLELSALNRGLKTGDPAMLKVAEQKGMTQADALAKEKAINAALDPALDTTGIDSSAIRKTFSQLSTVESRLKGRTTVTEPNKASGLGRLTNFDVAHPLRIVPEAAQGARDIVAGKPWLYGKATDADIAAGFKDAGPKPDLGQFNPQPMPRRLGSGAIELGMPDASGPTQFTPPPIDATTRAQRLGLLLPEESGGKVIPAYHDPMTPGERSAALLQDLRRRSQLALPANAQPRQLPSPASSPDLPPTGGSVGNINVLSHTLDEYRANPDMLIDELEKRGLSDDPSRSVIGLRGIYKEELGKTPRKSWHSPDGEKQYRLNGTSTVGITGNYFSEPGGSLRESIPSAIDRVKRYGDTDYIALIRGNGDNAYSNDIGEQVIKQPEVLAYIRRKSK